jgi:hypothetical protein
MEALATKSKFISVNKPLRNIYPCPTARTVILIAKFLCRNICYVFEQLSCICCEYDSVFTFIPIIYLLYTHNQFDVDRKVVVFKYISSVCNRPKSGSL